MKPRLTFILCAMLIVVFSTCGYLTITRQSSTIDEPIGTLASYLQTRGGEFRYDVDNPPLWKYWASLPNAGRALKPDAMQSDGVNPDAHPDALPPGDQFVSATRRLFQTPGNDGEAFVNRSRVMMLLIGIALAAAIARWAYELAGATAAIAACALFCFDPNFIAHAPLVKADVTVAMLITCAAWMTWRIGRRATWWNIASLALVCAAASVVKYNGLFAGTTSLLLLICRALMKDEWHVLSFNAARRTGKLFAAMSMALIACLVAFVVIWGSYRFRYAPSAMPNARLDVTDQVRQIVESKRTFVNGSTSTVAGRDEVDQPATLPPLVPRIASFLDQHCALPQAWLFGLVSIYRSSTTSVRPSYLLGETSLAGWWYYFPIAILVKTPIVTMLAIVSGAGVLVLVRPRDTSVRGVGALDRWSAACLLVPPLLYGLAALTSSANAGLRHVLPIYPPIFVCVGLAAARSLERRRRATAIATSVLGAALAVESLWAFPHYLSFFNVAARAQRFTLLGDSNFDWGQDLKAVAEWQRTHRDATLYLGYWGPTDPGFYGIQFVAMPGGFASHDVAETFSRKSPPGVLMISASLLQGVNFPPDVQRYYATLRRRPPKQVIGDTIYVYEWPLDVRDGEDRDEARSHAR